MPPLYDCAATENIDIGRELSRPVTAHVKFDPQHGIRDLFDGISVRTGSGEITDSTADAVKPFQAILTSTKSNVWENSDSENHSEKDKAVLQLLESYLHNAVFSSRWTDVGISEPTEACKASALSLSMLIYKQLSILPIRIAPSIEEGIMVTYQEENDKMLVEVYNTGEIAGLLRNDTNILKAVDYDNPEDVIALASEYKNLLS